MLNKWVKMREEEDPTSLLSRRSAQRKKRPYLATQCEHVADAERYRRQIVAEIADGIKKIQNPGMGEHALRDLNDGINKLIREKWHWNRRIRELGGKDHNKEERRAMAEAEAQGGTGVDGKEDPQLAVGLALKGSGGYRYFGAAKELPGVKELFARHAAKITKRKRGDVYKYITPDYYGLRDEEDGVLLELEGKMTEDRCKKLKECREEYRKLLAKQDGQNNNNDDDNASDDSDAAFVEAMVNGIPPEVAVPSPDTVANILLAKKKEALLNRFT